MVIVVVVVIVNVVIVCILVCVWFFYGMVCDCFWGWLFDWWMVMIYLWFGLFWVGMLLVGGFGIFVCFLLMMLLLVLSGIGLIVIYVGISIVVMVGWWIGWIVYV